MITHTRMHILATLLTGSTLAVALSSAQTIKGQFDCMPAGAFNLCQNLWGISAGTGSQSSTLIGTSGSSVSWSTNWTWANGPNNVKSYANVESTSAKGVQLQNIASAPTAWSWHYETQSSGIRADVAYDIWTGVPSVGNPASANSSYEIMIWLSGLGGIQPVGSQITTATPVAGHTWNIWKGPNANWQVISFVSSTGNIPDFAVDLKDFFTYLIASQGVPATQYLQSIQAGTEAFVGAADLVTDNYNVTVVRL
ncbi:endocellulase [Mycena floridula]|nr:endocellulase [Mycena floridula]